MRQQVVLPAYVVQPYPTVRRLRQSEDVPSGESSVRGQTSSACEVTAATAREVACGGTLHPDQHELAALI
eukprot:4698832-Prymnesium_polylepis.1